MFKEEFDARQIVEMFSHMENILHFGAYTMDLETKELKWSKGMYIILGVKPYPEQNLQEVFYRYIDKEDVANVKEAVARSLQQKVPYRIEFSITTPSGQHRRIYAENHMKFNSTGELLEYSGIIKDITENYQYKKALELKIDELNKSNENLQEFVYIASHDLQEPLRKVATFIDRFNLKYGSNLKEDDAKDYIKRIVSSVKNMQTLLEDLLSFSRISFSDKKFERISLDKILGEVLEDLEVKIEETKSKVDCYNLPELFVYPTQIRQLFNNLIGNSIKFTKKGESPHIWITTSKATSKEYPDVPLRKDTRYAVVTIRDNGIGFEHEYSKQIFKLFQRLHGKSEYSGSGIGLSICKKIMDNHNGFITAHGVPGHGSTFTMFFPER